MEKVNLLEQIYKRFWIPGMDYPAGGGELEYEKSLAIILYAKILGVKKSNYDIKQLLNYDITQVLIDRQTDITDIIDEHMLTRYDFCQKYGIPNPSKASDIMRELRKKDIQKCLTDYSGILEYENILGELRKKNIYQCLSFVFAIYGNDIVIDSHILKTICEYLKDFIFIHVLRDDDEDDDDDEDQLGGGKYKYKKHKNKSKSKKSKYKKHKRRKSKRRKSKRRKTRRKKR